METRDKTHVGDHDLSVTELRAEAVAELERLHNLFAKCQNKHSQEMVARMISRFHDSLYFPPYVISGSEVTARNGQHNNWGWDQ